MASRVLEVRLASQLFSAELTKVNEVRALLYEQEGEQDIGQNEANRSIFKSSEFSKKVNRLMLGFCATLCLVDLFGIEQARNQNARIETHQLRLFKEFISVPRFKFVQVSDWGRRARRKAWPYLLLSVWLTCTIHLIYHLYHLYAYDYYQFRLARVRWFNETQPAEVVQSFKALESEQFLLNKLYECRLKLEQIGTPQLGWSFLPECACIFVLLSTTILYLLPSVYFLCVHPFDFYFVRNLFDYEHEQRRCARFVETQVHEFAHSMANWSRALLSTSVKSYDGKLLSPNGVGLIDCATIERSQLFNQLEEMLLAGQLRPLNQSAKWVNHWSLYYTWILLSVNAYVLTSNTTLIILSINFLDQTPNGRQANLVLVYVEIAILLTIIQVSVTLCGATLAFTCLDQVMLVNKLRKWLALTIELNDLRFHRQKMMSTRWQLLSATFRTKLDSSDEMINSLRWSEVGLQNQMNRDIMLFLMHYRIFLAQLTKLKRALRIIVACALVGIFLMPLISRLHVIYCPINQMELSRAIMVAISLTTMLPVNVYLVPVCNLNKRCIDLYCQLNSLLAHVTQISLDSSQQEDARLTHDRHLIISLLRKELAHHDQMKRQLTVKILGLTCTFDTLVRLHFYAGFIILSLMGENLAQIKEPTGTIFSDPLGLF